MERWQRVAKAIRRRRGELNVTQQQLASRDPDISIGTIKKLESGRELNYRAQQIAAADRALGWDVGTIDRIASGGLDPWGEAPPGSVEADIAWAEDRLRELRSIADEDLNSEHEVLIQNYESELDIALRLRERELAPPKDERELAASQLHAAAYTARRTIQERLATLTDQACIAMAAEVSAFLDARGVPGTERADRTTTALRELATALEEDRRSSQPARQSRRRSSPPPQGGP